MVLHTRVLLSGVALMITTFAAAEPAIGGAIPDPGPDGDSLSHAAPGSDREPGYVPSAVRVIHVHAESPAVQAYYGYHAGQEKAGGRIPDSARGEWRFERIKETKTGPDHGYADVGESMNSTVVARVDLSGNLSQVCLHGAAEDVAEHEHGAQDPGHYAAGNKTTSAADARGDE